MNDRESSAWSTFKASASSSSDVDAQLINAAKEGTLENFLNGEFGIFTLRGNLSHVSLHVLQQVYELSKNQLIKGLIDQRIVDMTSVAVAQFAKERIGGSLPAAAQVAPAAPRPIPKAAAPRQNPVLDFLQTKGRTLEGFRELIRNYGHFSEDEAVTIFTHLPDEKEWIDVFNKHQTDTEPSAPPLLEQRSASPVPISRPPSPKVGSLGTDLCAAITKGGYHAFAEFEITHIDEMEKLSLAELDTAIEEARKRNYSGIIQALEGYKETAIRNYPLRLSDGSHGSSEKMNFDDEFEKYKKQESRDLRAFENFLTKLGEPLTDPNYQKVLEHCQELRLDEHIRMLEAHQNPPSWGLKKEASQAKEGIVEEFKDPGIARAEILEQEAAIPPYSFEEDLIDAAKSSESFQNFIRDNRDWLSRCSSETLDTMILVTSEPLLSKQLTDFRETKTRFNDEFSRIAKGKDSARFFDFIDNNQDNIKNLLSQDTLENLLKIEDLDSIIKETLEVTIKERITIGFAEILRGPHIQRNFAKCLESISRKSPADQVLYKKTLAEYVEKNPALGLRMPQNRFARIEQLQDQLIASSPRNILFQGLSDTALSQKSPRDKLEHIILHGSLSYESMDVDSYDWSPECLDIIQDLVRSSPPYSEDSTLQNLLDPARNTGLSPKERVVQIAQYFDFLQTTGRYVPMDDMSFVRAPVRPGMSIQAQASIDRPGSPLQNLHGNLALNEQIPLDGGGSISLNIKEHRRIKGGGDCYYRAVCVGAIESYLVQPPQKRHQLFNALADKLERLHQAGDFMRTIGYLRGLGSLSSKVTVADFEGLLIIHEFLDQDLVKAMKYLLAEECKNGFFYKKPTLRARPCKVL